MDISGVGDNSLMDGLAQLATSRSASSVKGDIQAAVNNQIKQSEKAQAEIVNKLIESMPSPDPNIGKVLNKSA